MWGKSFMIFCLHQKLCCFVFAMNTLLCSKGSKQFFFKVHCDFMFIWLWTGKAVVASFKLPNQFSKWPLEIIYIYVKWWNFYFMVQNDWVSKGLCLPISLLCSLARDRFSSLAWSFWGKGRGCWEPILFWLVSSNITGEKEEHVLGVGGLPKPWELGSGTK